MPLVEVTFHGRGGQGAVTGAIILAEAAAREGKWCQASPLFRAERRGAPVKSFARIDDKYIRVRGEITHPDVVVVLDPTLLDAVDVTEGLKKGGVIVMNTKKAPKEMAEKFGFPNVVTVDASEIAMDVLGKKITNTAMLGALVNATRLVKLDTVLKVAKEKFPGKIGEKNAEAIKRAYAESKVWLA